MTTVSKATAERMRKLLAFPEELRKSEYTLPVTRLTALKNLYENPESAQRFALFLAGRTQQQAEEKVKSSTSISANTQLYLDTIHRLVSGMESYLQQPPGISASELYELLHSAASLQNTTQWIHGTPVRIIQSMDLLMVELALRTVLASVDEKRFYVYQTARHYAERSQGSGAGYLSKHAAPLVQEIVDFWMIELGLTHESLEKMLEKKRSPRSGQTRLFTNRQGQFLAYIHQCHNLLKRPTDTEIARYFKIKETSARSMLNKLLELKLIDYDFHTAGRFALKVPTATLPELPQPKKKK